jgi:hypothetical protein
VSQRYDMYADAPADAEARAAFRRRLYEANTRHRAETRAWEEAGDQRQYTPRCDLCGDLTSDNQQGLDMWDFEQQEYVAMVHFEGCKERVQHMCPDLKTDYDL